MPRETRGFSLVELMVVVAILMVITAIALPYYLSATQRAHEAAAVGYLRSLQTAQETYRLANHQYADHFSQLAPYLAVEKTTPPLPHAPGDFWVTVAFAGPVQGKGGTPPGQGGTPPGQGGTPPGQGGTPPGQGGTPPGQGGTPPGQSGTPPGQGGHLPVRAGRLPARAEAHQLQTPLSIRSISSI